MVAVSFNRINCVPVRTFVRSIAHRIIFLLRENAETMIQMEARTPRVKARIAGVMILFRSNFLATNKQILMA